MVRGPGQQRVGGVGWAADGAEGHWAPRGLVADAHAGVSCVTRVQSVIIPL